MEAFLIRRLLEYLLVIAVARTIGAVSSFYDLVIRFCDLPEVSQIGVISVLVLVGSSLAQIVRQIVIVVREWLERHRDNQIDN